MAFAECLPGADLHTAQPSPHNDLETAAMNPDYREPQESSPAAGLAATPRDSGLPEDECFYRIPAPPVPGKIAWSLNPWLPE
ncbi:hypothetical protein SAMN02949497_2618 [Methylomagnum ishizawai]|uniref:Uncharacterized protein n=2 Tax=Methylomagnum ishizawai TaxID=1760988 RepID=A0A1Y6D3Z4_9GAMM|nr:hypothetical protein SAMN02949497_2618 [Methylomagnum ishizawai]